MFKRKEKSEQTKNKTAQSCLQIQASGLVGQYYHTGLSAALSNTHKHTCKHAHKHTYTHTQTNTKSELRNCSIIQTLSFQDYSRQKTTWIQCKHLQKTALSLPDSKLAPVMKIQHPFKWQGSSLSLHVVCPRYNHSHVFLGLVKMDQLHNGNGSRRNFEFQLRIENRFKHVAKK